MDARAASFRAVFIAILLNGVAGDGTAVMAGQLTLKLRGRGACRARGLLSAAAGCGRSNRISLSTHDTGSGRQHWEVVPVRDGPIEGSPVILQVGGRGQCASFATYAANCRGEVTLQPWAASGQLQQFVLRQQADGSYSVAPILCPSRLLGFAHRCTKKMAQLVKLNNGLTAWIAAIIRSPSPPPPPLPPLASPSPPLPSIVLPTPGIITATAVKLSEWSTGFEGTFRIGNGKNYTLLSWDLSFTFADNFTWGPSDADLEWNGTRVTLRPKDWNRKIPPNVTLSIGFGGRSQLPYDFAFNLYLPLEDFQADPSLRSRGQFGAKLFAPYLDILAWPTPQLRTGVVAATGHLFYRLAFITARVTAKGTRPAWGGVVDLEELFFYDQVRQLRLLGGDVIVSFGGANGQELAQVIHDENALVAAYQSVIDTYFLRWVDFDIEGAAVADPESVDRRNRAIARLQAANPGLTVSYCLPVLPIGLTIDGVALLANAVAHGVRVDEISLMAMDYGDSAAPNPKGKMGYYAKQAAINAYAQALNVYLPASTKIGLIPMIGVNDVLSEVFTLADACQVAAFAWDTKWMRSTSFWSVNRDNYEGPVGAVSGSSGIPQKDWAFSRILAAGAAGNTTPACVTAATKHSQQLPQLQGPLAGAPRSQLGRVEKVAYGHNWQRWTQVFPGIAKARRHASKERKVKRLLLIPA